jgi:hypothetical protein
MINTARRVSQVITAVCQVTAYEPEALVGSSKERALVVWRHTAWFILCGPRTEGGLGITHAAVAAEWPTPRCTRATIRYGVESVGLALYDRDHEVRRVQRLAIERARRELEVIHEREAPFFARYYRAHANGADA